MKKLDDLMHDFDKSVDKKINPFLNSFKKHFTTVSTGVLILLLLIFFVKVIREKPFHLTAIIANDINQIENILNQIDKDCNILSLNSDKIPVDFLNVEKFSGSTVGCLNLAYPIKWTGPYMHRNPTLQSKFYEICKTKDGCYIVPGQGVKLPNGLIIGKDFVINNKTNMENLIQANGPLNYKGEVVVRKIQFKIGDWDNPITKDANKLEKINDTLKEFNQAFSFTCNSNIQEANA
jgi:hypothetical protein